MSSAADIPATKTLFTSHLVTSNYALYRPTYPPEMYALIKNEVEAQGIHINRENSIVVDMACGSGQATFGLAKPPMNANRILGTDISPQQIQHARAKVEDELKKLGRPEVKFHFEVGSVEDIPAQLRALQTSDDQPLLPSIVTVAQAFHWLEVPKAMSVLYPLLQKTDAHPTGGAFAVIFYGSPFFETPALQKIVMEDLYNARLGNCWGAGRSHIDDEYRQMAELIRSAQEPDAWEVHRFDPPEMASAGEQSNVHRRVVDPSLRIVREMPLDGLIGYLSSWSAYGVWQKKKADGLVDVSESDPIEECRQKLLKEVGSPDALIKVTYPIGLFLCYPK